jgi:hypothetical protein
MAKEPSESQWTQVCSYLSGSCHMPHVDIWSSNEGRSLCDRCYLVVLYQCWWHPCSHMLWTPVLRRAKSMLSSTGKAPTWVPLPQVDSLRTGPWSTSGAPPPQWLGPCSWKLDYPSKHYWYWVLLEPVIWMNLLPCCPAMSGTTTLELGWQDTPCAYHVSTKDITQGVPASFQ